MANAQTCDLFRRQVFADVGGGQRNRCGAEAHRRTHFQFSNGGKQACGSGRLTPEVGIRSEYSQSSFGHITILKSISFNRLRSGTPSGFRMIVDDLGLVWQFWQ